MNTINIADNNQKWSEITGRAELNLCESYKATLEKLKCANGLRFSLWVLLHMVLWLALVMVALSLRESPWIIVCTLLLGNQLHAITILQHDCGHGSGYRSAAANLWVGRFLAWFIFMPFTTFTYIHKRHHAFLGQPGKDPDEWFYAAGARWVFMREILFLPRFVYQSLGARLPERIRHQVRRELIFNTLSWAVAIWLSLHFGLAFWFLMTFIVPMLLLATVINPISRGYEHFPMSQIPAHKPERLDLRANTVTVTSRLLGFMWANITFHVEHHVYPTVPFYLLPDLHELMLNKNYCREPYPLFRLVRRDTVSDECMSGQ